jgi:predicted nucleic acid-binding protein
MMTGGANAVFVDTNVLVYAAVAQAPLHQQAQSALQSLRQANVPMWISPQVIREYLAVMTRPQTFGQPLSAADAARDAEVFVRRFRLADVNAAVTDNLLQLLSTVQVAGKQVHDANIVATMRTHGIERLLTHNVSDFARYDHLITILALEDELPDGQATA